MEPGWSPLPGDLQPYLQVDLLEPTWVSGVVTQGTERMWGYLSKYRLAFALVQSHFTDYTETGERGSPAKVVMIMTIIHFICKVLFTSQVGTNLWNDRAVQLCFSSSKSMSFSKMGKTENGIKSVLLYCNLCDLVMMRNWYIYNRSNLWSWSFLQIIRVILAPTVL